MYLIDLLQKEAYWDIEQNLKMKASSFVVFILLNWFEFKSSVSNPH